MRYFAIYGGGGFGREILPMARIHMRHRRDAGLPDVELVFAEDSPAQDSISGVRVIPFSELRPDDQYIIAVGSSSARKMMAERCDAAGLAAASIWHDGVVEGQDIIVGEGAVICAHSTITASVRIGRHFQCNVYSYVAHDCIVGDFVTFAPRISCNGNVHIGDGAYIGTGAIIRNGSPDRPLTIGAGALVGMGAVVTRDVPPGATVFGNPARIISKTSATDR